MAVTFTFLNATAWGSSHGSLQDRGLAPTTTRAITGWTAGTVASSNYAKMAYGSEVASGTFSSTIQPSGTPGSTDCLRSINQLTGSFNSGNWTVAIALRSATSAYAGRCQLQIRVWKSVNQDGSSATELTTSPITVGPTGASLSTTVNTNLTATWSAPSIILNKEYIFFQIALQITSAGSGSTQDVLLVQDATNTVITTTTFTDTSNFTRTYLDTFVNGPNGLPLDMSLWQCSNPIIKQDKNPSRAGDLLFFVYNGNNTATDRWYVFTSKDNGATWSYIAASNSPPNPDTNNTDNPNSLSLTQDTVNYKLHIAHWNINASFMYYSRITLAYDGSGHINGWSWDVQRQTGPSFDDSGSADSIVRLDMQIVIDGNSHQRLMVFGVEETSTLNQTGRLSAAVTTVSAGLAPTAGTDWVKITDGSAGLDHLASWYSDSSTDSTALVSFQSQPVFVTQHKLTVAWAQHPANNSLNLWVGYYDFNDGGSSDCALWRFRFTASGNNWASSVLGTVVANSSAVPVAPNMGSAVATANYVWFCYNHPTNGITIDKVDASGTYTSGAITSPDTSTTSTSCAYLSHSVASDETRLWVMWDQHGNSPLYNRSGYYDGSSWTIFDETRVFLNNAWTTGAGNWSHGSFGNGAAILAQGNTAGEWHLHTFLFTTPTPATFPTGIFIRPRTIPRINRANPLANNVAMAIVGDIGDIVTGAGITYGTNAGSITNQTGSVPSNTTVTAASNIIVNLPSNSPLFSITKDISYLYFVNINSLSGNLSAYTLFDSPNDNNATADNFASFPAVSGTSSQYTFTYNDTTATEFSLVSPTGWVSTGYQVIGAVRNTAAGTVQFYRNGFPIGSSAIDTSANAIRWNSSQGFRLLNQQGNAGVQGDANLFYVFNRVLSNAEMLSVSSDPLSLLDYSDDFLSFGLFFPTTPVQGFSNYLESNLLNFLFRTQSSFISKPTNISIALCTSSPGETGTTIRNEVPNTNGYARVSLGAPADATWSAPANSGDGRIVKNSSAITFPTATGTGWGSITHVAICDSSTWGGGNVLFAQQINNSGFQINSGMAPKFNINSLTVTVD